MKMLEIGLGCNHITGAGASVALWKKLFPEIELWEAELDAKCVNQTQAEGKLDGLNVLVGDQNDINTLDKWIEASGGAFDIIVDDGGHKNCEIWTSFQKLWPKLLPGGIYFIEDLWISRHEKFSDVSSPMCDKSTNMMDILKQTMDEVIHSQQRGLFKDVKYVHCQEDACTVGKKGPTEIENEIKFLESAKSLSPTSDKVTAHQYHIMYGHYLLPYHSMKPAMKMLDLGLGCGMDYGPGVGASFALWKKLFPRAELWGATKDGKCIEKSKAGGKVNGFNDVLTGDQMNVDTLDQWIHITRGAKFDVVVDSGGHTQCEIWTAFQKLWPKLMLGGLYFIEGLHASHDPVNLNISSPICEKNTSVTEILKDNIEQFVHRKQPSIQNVKFIFCQDHACVVGKK